MIANGEAVEGVVDDNPVLLVPVFGRDELDILYVRVLSEQNESTESAIERAERIADRLTFKTKRFQAS